MHYLTEELVRMGHDVTLMASGDSDTSACLMPICPQATRLDRACKEPVAWHVAMLERVVRDAAEYDVIHNHIEWLLLPALHEIPVPVISTIHSRMDIPEMAAVYRYAPDASSLVSISNAQRRPLPWVNWYATVYHGLPPQLYRFDPEGGQYLAFVGRFSPEKGPLEAIEIAKRAGVPLKMAAKVDDKDRDYYEAKVRRQIESSSLIEYVGEVGEKDKEELLRGALGLLLPINWPEPFGLVMIEAMACGTPTIAFRNGSVPEVIDDGVTGFIVKNTEEAAAAVDKLSSVPRSGCREVFDHRFTSRVMARRYVAIFERLLLTQLELAARFAPRVKGPKNRPTPRGPEVLDGKPL